MCGGTLVCVSLLTRKSVGIRWAKRQRKKIVGNSTNEMQGTEMLVSRTVIKDDL